MSTSVYFPSISDAPTPLEMAELDRAIRELERLNEELARSSQHSSLNRAVAPPASDELNVADKSLCVPTTADATMVDRADNGPEDRLNDETVINDTAHNTRVENSAEYSSDLSEYSYVQITRKRVEEKRVTSLGETVSVFRTIVKRKPIPKYLINGTKVTSLAQPSRPALPPAKPAPLPAKFTFQDFKLRRVLGAGGQGKVYLATAERYAPSRFFAMKVICKFYRGQPTNINFLLQEQSIMKKIRHHPFLLSMLASFHDSSFFYIITDFLCGGDLQKLLYYEGVFDQAMASFYAAEMVLGIQYLHKNNVIHRDLKLANVFLKANGHIAIADFGLSKEFDCSSFPLEQEHITLLATSCCGTLSYMAPEVLTRTEYSFAVDWWSLGVCIYAMLQGQVPWDYPGDEETVQAICHDDVPYRIDVELDIDAIALIEGLLRKDPMHRLPISGVFHHRFFNTINWDDLELSASTPPYIPNNDALAYANSTLPRNERFCCGLPSPYFRDEYPQYSFVSPEFHGNAYDMGPFDHLEARLLKVQPQGSSKTYRPTDFVERGPAIASLSVQPVLSVPFEEAQSDSTTAVCAEQRLDEPRTDPSPIIDISKFGKESSPTAHELPVPIPRENDNDLEALSVLDPSSPGFFKAIQREVYANPPEPQSEPYMITLVRALEAKVAEREKAFRDAESQNKTDMPENVVDRDSVWSSPLSFDPPAPVIEVAVTKSDEPKASPDLVQWLLKIGKKAFMRLRRLCSSWKAPRVL